MFSMAVGSIGKWLKLVPFFFVRGRTVDGGGGGGGVHFFKKTFFPAKIIKKKF